MQVDPLCAVATEYLDRLECRGTESHRLRLAQLACLCEQLERDRPGSAVLELGVDPNCTHQITLRPARKSAISLAASPLSSMTFPALRLSAGAIASTFWVSPCPPIGTFNFRSA